MTDERLVELVRMAAQLQRHAPTPAQDPQAAAIAPYDDGYAAGLLKAADIVFGGLAVADELERRSGLPDVDR